MMMVRRTGGLVGLVVDAILISLVHRTEAFRCLRLHSVRPIPATASLPTSRLRLSSSLSPEARPDEVEFRYMLAKAKECAYSDTSSSTDARAFLNRILELESLCVSGALAGRDLCDNVAEMADVVSHLRYRVLYGPASLRETNIAALGVMALLPASLLMLLLGLVAVSTYDWGTGSVPFTIEEWMWATKGGYLHSMIDHYTRNAGL